MDLRVDQFDYRLSPDRIAQRPAVPRDAARLMVVDRATGRIDHHLVRDLPGLLPGPMLLVLNNTRVIRARLFGRKPSTGARIELLLLRPLEEDQWQTMARPAKRLHPGDELEFPGARAMVTSRDGAFATVRFQVSGSFTSFLEQAGAVPLPPYISRPGGRADAADEEQYQTVFSVAP
ncbi:S-adenosylmethionine:tRNA ribosyltransferase-isomerase, partial [bacterium]|nr:S-adenosylmethionine:tRNA ribosyltransferase-isomerase [candidate division CSSED10-310 bacterium]